jgi:hypothetical protein
VLFRIRRVSPELWSKYKPLEALIGGLSDGVRLARLFWGSEVRRSGDSVLNGIVLALRIVDGIGLVLFAICISIIFAK